MTEADFEMTATKVIEDFAEAIDEALGDRLDADIQGGILTITMPGLGQYVINKHRPNREIWVSSPFSGAAHFRLSEGKWMSTRDNTIELAPLLSSEMASKYGITVSL